MLCEKTRSPIVNESIVEVINMLDMDIYSLLRSIVY